MVPISVGISGSLSAEQSPNRSIDGIGVPMNSVYCESKSDDNLVNSTWESPTNGPAVRESIEIVQDEEIGSNTEDVFSDWLQSYPESGPAEAAVDSVPLFRSDSVPFSLGCEGYDITPKRPCRPMSPDGVSVLTGPCRLFPPPLPVTPDISSHEIVPTSPFSRNPLSLTSVPSQRADDFSSPATRLTRKVEFDDAIFIPTSESLASAFEVQDNGVADITLSELEVFGGGFEEHTLETWPSSPPEFDTEDDSKELYSAVWSNPAYAGPDSDDEYEVPTAPASSRVHMTTDSAREESNGCANSSMFSTGPSARPISTPLFRDSQPSSFLESPSFSFDSVASLSILPSALSVSLSSMFVPSSSLSSFHSSLCLSPTSHWGQRAIYPVGTL